MFFWAGNEDLFKAFNLPNVLPQGSQFSLRNIGSRSKQIYIYLPNPSARAVYDTRSIFKRSLTGLNSEFSFSYSSCLTKAEEPYLPYYLPIAGERITGFMPLPRVLMLWEMQSVSSKIWTCVVVSISYDDNHYTTGTSTNIQTCKINDLRVCLASVVIHWYLSDNKSLQVSRTLLSIQANLNKVIFWMLSSSSDFQFRQSLF